MPPVEPRVATDVLRIAPRACWEELGGEVVVYDELEGACVVLNETGARFWMRLDGRRTTADIACELGEQFGVAGDLVADDLAALADQLVALRLIEAASGGPIDRDGLEQP